MDLCRGCSVVPLGDAHRVDVRRYRRPLLRPVLSDGLAPVHAPTLHAVRPVDGFGQKRQNARDVPSVEKRLPDACAALFESDREALSGFTDEEVGQLVALLTRLIANLDRVANAEASLQNPWPRRPWGPPHPWGGPHLRFANAAPGIASVGALPSAPVSAGRGPCQSLVVKRASKRWPMARRLGAPAVGA